MKKILLSLFGFITLGLVNFGFCDKYCDLIDTKDEKIPEKLTKVSYNYESVGYFNMVSVDSNNNYSWSITTTGGTMCFASEHISRIYDYYIYLNNVMVGDTVGSWNQIFNFACYEGVGTWTITNKNRQSTNVIVFNNSQFNSSSCQSTYNLVPSSDLSSCQSNLAIISGSLASCESDLSTCYYDYGECQSDLLDCQNSSGSSCPIIDTQYCMINGLCPSVSGSGFSNIYIYSDNQYTPLNSASNIYVNLPSYVGYDPSYSNGGNDLDINIGYVVDSGYINDIKDIQGSIPNGVDFNNIINYLLPLFVPGLCVILLLYFIFRFIKKIF